MLTGITLVRNGTTLGYPYSVSVPLLASLCDQVLVNCDPGTDNTMDHLLEIKSKFSNIEIIESRWDMKNTGDGRELAIQANNLLQYVKTPWTLYLQIDEMLHEKQFSSIRHYISKVGESYSQIELYRTYFWEKFDRRAVDLEIWLGRIFRSGTHQVGGDGMYLERLCGDVLRSPFWIYHYSRMGSEESVNTRLRNLDTLFHPKDEVDKYRKFSYSVDSEDHMFIGYGLSHPVGIKDFYNG